MPYPHRFIKLTPEQRKRLEREIHTALVQGQYRKRRRLQFPLLSDDGYTFGKIARRLKVCYRTVLRQVKTFETKGFDRFLKDDK